MLNIVLFEPEIPQNTGNIIRTCAAVNATLHLIKPYGFDFSKENIKRYSVDYIDDITIIEYENFEEFSLKNPYPLHIVTRYALKTYAEFSFPKDTYFVFGKESTGLPKHILQSHLDTCMRLPMQDFVRSLNLSNCVAIMSYEYLKQMDFEGLSKVEVQKGSDFILKD